MSIKGCDISGWQPGNVNLGGMDFLYVKSTQGTYKVNANHDAQVAQGRREGKVVGHYHFPAWGDPVAEAQAFVSANGALPGEFLVLDIEDSPQTPWPADPVSWCVAFATETYRLTGLWCMDYIGPANRSRWNWAPLAALGGGLISPEYNNVGPSSPAPWAATAMWQNANTNISGGDSDVFFGDRAALIAYGTPGAVTEASSITQIQEDELMVALDEPITTPDGGTTTLRTEIGWLAKNFAILRELVQAVPAGLLDTKVDKIGGGTTTPRIEFAWTKENFASLANLLLPIAQGVGSLKAQPAAAVDVPTLAAQLAAALNKDQAHQLLVELGNALPKA